MPQQPPLQVTLARCFAEHQKIEVVWVPGDFLRKIGLRRQEGALEVGDRFPLSSMETALDLMDQSGSAPAVLDGGLRVPDLLVAVGNLVEQDADWPPDAPVWP